MKKLILAMGMTIATTLSFAQFGLKGGISTTNLTVNDEKINDKQARFGYQAGVVFRIPIVEGHFAVQPEVLYSLKGAEYNTTFSKVTSKFSYIDVPVLLVLNPFGGSLNIHAGPQFSRLINVDNEYKILNTEVVISEDRDNFEDWEVSFAVGLGWNFEKAFLDLRYTKGLTDVEKERIQNGQTFDPKVRNFGIQLSVGFFLF